MQTGPLISFYQYLGTVKQTSHKSMFIISPIFQTFQILRSIKNAKKENFKEFVRKILCYKINNLKILKNAKTASNFCFPGSGTPIFQHINLWCTTRSRLTLPRSAKYQRNNTLKSENYC